MKVKLSWFSVNDFEGAKKFYGNVLGLKKMFEAQQWAEFAGAEGEETIGLAVNPHAGKEPGATIVLEVEDIEREHKRLETAGEAWSLVLRSGGGVAVDVPPGDAGGEKCVVLQVEHL